MHLRTKLSIVIALSTSGFLAISCGKKNDKNESTDGVQATSVAELKLSSALDLTLPATLAKASGQTSSLALSTNLVGKKSSEACRTIQQVTQMFDTLGSISGMMCHLEAETAQIKFGTKYKIILTENGETNEMPLWIDNSVSGQLTMYTCQAGAVREKISISSSNGTGAKGSILFSGSDGAQNYASSLEFDFTSSSAKILKGQNTYINGADAFSNDNVLEFRDPGVSLMTTANKGSSNGMTFQDRGAVKHNGTLGQALFKGQGTGSGQTYDFSSRATFDADGMSVANTTATSDIKIEATELPSFLADGFKIGAPSGWDCQTTETITVDIDNGATGAAHKACNRNHDMNFNCWGTDFEQGENETINN